MNRSTPLLLLMGVLFGACVSSSGPKVTENQDSNFKKVGFFFEGKNVPVRNVYHWHNSNITGHYYRARFDVDDKNLPRIFDGQGKTPLMENFSAADQSREKSFPANQARDMVFHQLHNPIIMRYISEWYLPQDLKEARFAYWSGGEGRNSHIIAYAIWNLGKGQSRVYIVSDMD